MARKLHGIEKGVALYSENGDLQVFVLAGSGAPVGTSGDTDDAPIGSVYYRTDGSGGVYKKVSDSSSASDWEEVGNIALDELRWRNETVIASTNDTLTAGSGVDPTAWTDNDQGLGGNDMTVGQYVVGDIDGTPALFEVTAITSNVDITLAAASQAIADNDTFVIQNHLPDPGAAQEAQAIIHFPSASAAGIKLADFNWALADGINLTGGYSAINGTVAGGDTVEAAISKLDGNQQDIQTASGLSQGDVDYGTFTGDIIPDNSTSKAALQALETELVDTRDNVDDLITLSGMPENSTDLGTFTGNTISDNTDVKNALQELESAFEATQTEGKATGITTITTVDEVLVDNFHEVEWELVMWLESNPAQKRYLKLSALHDGHNDGAGADATEVDVDRFSRKNVGSFFNGLFTVDLDGSTTTQKMRLRAQAASAVTVEFRRNGVRIQ